MICPNLGKKEVSNRDGTWSWEHHCAANEPTEYCFDEQIECKLQTNELNNLCKSCPEDVRGLCCYSSTQIGKYNIYLSKHPCKFLNKDTRRCSVYGKRKKVKLNCLTIEEMIITGNLPRQCLYIVNNQNYQNRKDVRIYHLPANLTEEGKAKYHRQNNLPHEEIAVYDIQRSFICPKCKSKELDEEFLEEDGNTPSEFFLYFSYKCDNCGSSWSNNPLKKTRVVSKN